MLSLTLFVRVFFFRPTVGLTPCLFASSILSSDNTRLTKPMDVMRGATDCDTINKCSYNDSLHLTELARGRRHSFDILDPNFPASSDTDASFFFNFFHTTVTRETARNIRTDSAVALEDVTVCHCVATSAVSLSLSFFPLYFSTRLLYIRNDTRTTISNRDCGRKERRSIWQTLRGGVDSVLVIISRRDEEIPK